MDLKNILEGSDDGYDSAESIEVVHHGTRRDDTHSPVRKHQSHQSDMEEYQYTMPSSDDGRSGTETDGDLMNLMEETEREVRRQLEELRAKDMVLKEQAKKMIASDERMAEKTGHQKWLPKDDRIKPSAEPVEEGISTKQAGGKKRSKIMKKKIQMPTTRYRDTKPRKSELLAATVAEDSSPRNKGYRDTINAMLSGEDRGSKSPSQYLSDDFETDSISKQMDSLKGDLKRISSMSQLVLNRPTELRKHSSQKSLVRQYILESDSENFRSGTDSVDFRYTSAGTDHESSYDSVQRPRAASYSTDGELSQKIEDINHRLHFVGKQITPINTPLARKTVTEEGVKKGRDKFEQTRSKRANISRDVDSKVNSTSEVQSHSLRYDPEELRKRERIRMKLLRRKLSKKRKDEKMKEQEAIVNEIERQKKLEQLDRQVHVLNKAPTSRSTQKKSKAAPVQSAKKRKKGSSRSRASKSTVPLDTITRRVSDTTRDRDIIRSSEERQSSVSAWSLTHSGTGAYEYAPVVESDEKYERERAMRRSQQLALKEEIRRRRQLEKEELEKRQREEEAFRRRRESVSALAEKIRTGRSNPEILRPEYKDTVELLRRGNSCSNGVKQRSSKDVSSPKAIAADESGDEFADEIMGLMMDTMEMERQLFRPSAVHHVDGKGKSHTKEIPIIEVHDQLSRSVQGNNEDPFESTEFSREALDKRLQHVIEESRLFHPSHGAQEEEDGEEGGKEEEVHEPRWKEESVDNDIDEKAERHNDKQVSDGKEQVSIEMSVEDIVHVGSVSGEDDNNTWSTSPPCELSREPTLDSQIGNLDPPSNSQVEESEVELSQKVGQREVRYYNPPPDHETYMTLDKAEIESEGEVTERRIFVQLPQDGDKDAQQSENETLDRDMARYARSEITDTRDSNMQAELAGEENFVADEPQTEIASLSKRQKLLKYTKGGKGKPHERYFYVNIDKNEICWTDKVKGGKVRNAKVLSLERGLHGLRRKVPDEVHERSFTIECGNTSLYLSAPNVVICESWVRGLHSLLTQSNELQQHTVQDSQPVKLENKEQETDIHDVLQLFLEENQVEAPPTVIVTADDEVQVAKEETTNKLQSEDVEPALVLVSQHPDNFEQPHPANEENGKTQLSVAVLEEEMKNDADNDTIQKNVVDEATTDESGGGKQVNGGEEEDNGEGDNGVEARKSDIEKIELEIEEQNVDTEDEKFYQAVTFLQQRQKLREYTKEGKGKQRDRYFFVNFDTNKLCWTDKILSGKNVKTADIQFVTPGLHSMKKKKIQDSEHQKGFTVDIDGCSLFLSAPDTTTRDNWVQALQTFLSRLNKASADL